MDEDLDIEGVPTAIHTLEATPSAVVLGRNGRRVNPIHVYDRKIHCPDYLFEDKVISPVFRDALQKYAMAYFRPCVLRRTASGNVDNHVVRCIYIDGLRQQVQFVEENGQAKRAFNIQDITLIAIETPAKSILGVSLAPTIGVVLKSSPAIQGSKLAAQAKARIIKQEEAAAAKEARKKLKAERKAGKNGASSMTISPMTSGALSPSPSGIPAKAAPGGQGDPNDMVLRFEPFPPPKPAKGAPPPTPEEVQRVRKETLVDATAHMEEFVALLRHFNPYIVVREKLPHGIVSRMPLKLDKPPGKGPQVDGPPTLVSDPLTENDMYPPEDSDPDLDDLDLDEEAEEEPIEEQEEVEEEPEYVPPPPPPQEEPESEAEEPEYVPPPMNRPSTPPPPPLAEPSFYVRPNEDDLIYPSFPGYEDSTKVKNLFILEGVEGPESANYDHSAPLVGPPYAVAGTVKAFPIAYNTVPLTDSEVALETVHTTVAVEVIRAVKKIFKDKIARAKAKARHEEWAKRSQLAASANLPLPSAPMDGSEDSDQDVDITRPGALLPVPSTISPPSVEAIYSSLQSAYEQEDLRIKESLIQRRIFIESQLSYLEVDVLPQLLARRKRADDLLQEMASSARLRGQVLAPTSRLAHPNYDRHVNLAVIIFDICRTRKQKLEHNEMLEAERAAGVSPSGYRRVQHGGPLL